MRTAQLVKVLRERLGAPALYTKHAVFLQQASEAVHDGVHKHALGRRPDTRTVCVGAPESIQQR